MSRKIPDGFHLMLSIFPHMIWTIIIFHLLAAFELLETILKYIFGLQSQKILLLLAAIRIASGSEMLNKILRQKKMFIFTHIRQKDRVCHRGDNLPEYFGVISSSQKPNPGIFITVPEAIATGDTWHAHFGWYF
nr:MAG TPA: hypothetical protein [Caudoviricetes sp.]